MKNKNFLALFFMFFYTCNALAAGIDANPDKRGWHIELKRFSADFSSTSIQGQKEYEEFSDSRISGDSQLIAQGNFNFGLDFYAPRYVVFNSIFAEYGRTILMRDNERITNTMVDRIILSTDYTHRIWYVPSFVGGFEVGPFGKASYQSGFENKQKITRLSAGAKLFDGIYLKDFSVSGFAEENFTENISAASYGWEGRIDMEYKINEDSKFSYYTNLRHYLYSSTPDTYNPLYQLEVEIRLDTKLYNKLAIAPFVKYYALQGRHISKLGSNLFIGFSLSLKHTFVDATKRQNYSSLTKTTP